MNSSSREMIIIGTSCAGVFLLLSLMVFFPFGHDQALFEAGGAAIAKNNAIPFRDFIDMKQPLIFYIYAAAISIFGRHEWSPRAFDFVFHSISLIFFFRLVYRTSGSK